MDLIDNKQSVYYSEKKWGEGKYKKKNYRTRL